MKCILLAGGIGDRLWPLSRKGYPKQFLNFDGDRSLFQETITRNLPFCDEFLVVTQESLALVAEGQLVPFAGLAVQLLKETESGGTAPAVRLALSKIDPSELVFILPADLLIDAEDYGTAVYQARTLAEEGRICLFGVRPSHRSPSYGYITRTSPDEVRFVEKPDDEEAQRLFADPDTWVNSGMTLARASVLSEALAQAPQVRSFEEAVLQNRPHLAMIPLSGAWEDVSDYTAYEQLLAGGKTRTASGPVLSGGCEATTVINTCPDRLVVAGGLKNTLVVSTADAVYVTDRSGADKIRNLIRDHHDEYASYFDESPELYRSWGTRQVLRREPGFRVRKVMIYPGASISRHLHERRNENYSVVSGTLTVEVEGRIRLLSNGEGINILPGQMHRLSNETDEPVIAIEVDTGAEIDEADICHAAREEVPGFDARRGRDLPALYRMQPEFKDYLWGGQRLRDQLKKNTPYEVTAESWELSAHPAGPSVISGGPFNGMPFDRFVETYPFVSGWKSRTFDRFPILIKLIDAARPLSVQVHPEDDYAFQHENEFGKNEFWYVLDAAPGAHIYCGLKKECTREELLQAIRENRITELLNRIEVHAGDVIYVPAGTLHAIGEGILICEIQQNSDTTYRVYDYDRVDANGQKRPLHLQKALDVVNTKASMPDLSGAGRMEDFGTSKRQLIARCKYFECLRYVIPKEEQILMDEASFKAIVLLSGSCRLSSGDEELSMQAGDCAFARSGRRVLHVSGECEMLVVNV